MKNKDWNGEPYSYFRMIGASNHTEKEREAHDFYATDPKAVDALLGYAPLKLPKKIWEPSCGMGHLSERLKERGYDVVSTDLVDRGYGQGGVDFFAQDAVPPDVCCILTNPPYKYATEYICHALEILPEGGYLCMFVKTTFAEGAGRYRDIFSTKPPKYILQFVSRVICAMNGDFKTYTGSAVSYAWFIWEKGYKGHTTFDWINIGKIKTKKQENELKLF